MKEKEENKHILVFLVKNIKRLNLISEKHILTFIRTPGLKPYRDQEYQLDGVRRETGLDTWTHFLLASYDRVRTPAVFIPTNWVQGWNPGPVSSPWSRHSRHPDLQKVNKGEWSVMERTTFMEYLCNGRSWGGSEGSFGIVGGMPFFFSKFKFEASSGISFGH